MREIILDTETTGLSPDRGDRLVEVGCVEVMNYIPTGKTFHRYFNPQRDMPEEAFRVHGLSAEFLSKHKVFSEEVDDFLDFIGDARLVIHNAQFDMNFLNAELARLKKPILPPERAFCTLVYARKKFPGAPAGLDALCRRFGVDNSHRTLHGALLDAEILADVYLQLMGGRQTGLAFADGPGGRAGEAGESAALTAAPKPFRAPRPHAATAAELEAHAAFLKTVKNPLWLRD